MACFNLLLIICIHACLYNIMSVTQVLYVLNDQHITLHITQMLHNINCVFYYREIVFQ